MPRQWMIGLAVLLIPMLASCGVKARNYVMVKERVDQDMQGNGGYLMGQSTPRGEYKRTRKLYILELTQKLEEDEYIDQDINYDTDSKVVVSKPANQNFQPRTAERPKIKGKSSPRSLPDLSDIPDFSDEDDFDFESATDKPSKSYSNSKEYTVQKNDTLQKIAKKFYGGYSKWPRIYDANRQAIKNPNVLKPGTVLTIPLD